MSYEFRKIEGTPEFSDHFSKTVLCYKRKGYSINDIKQSAFLGVIKFRLTNLLTSLITRRWVGVQTL